MHHRILTALLIPVLVLINTQPAEAIFGAITGTIQRAQMIANQVTQISNQLRQVSTMTRQLSELEDQLTHMKQAALGEVNALTSPFTDLAASSIGLVGEGLSWGSDFTGAAGELVDAVRDMGNGSSLTGIWRSTQSTADQVHEQDILDLFSTHPAEVSTRAVERYRTARDAVDRQRVLDYATLDAAAALAEAIQNAQESFDTLKNNGNLSNTALQQAQVAAVLTQGQVDAAVGQLLAYQAVEQANRMRQAELDRLERLSAWRDAQIRANETFERMQAAVSQNRDNLREGLLFQVHPFYMGAQT